MLPNIFEAKTGAAASLPPRSWQTGVSRRVIKHKDDDDYYDD